MQDNLKILFVEDSELHVEIIKRELEKADFKIKWERVDSKESMKTALEQKEWDIILSDHIMPDFDSIQALETLREYRLEIPFIVVSGKIGEEKAIELIKKGCHDYVMKDNLKRLGTIVRRVLKEVKEKQENDRIKRKFIEDNEHLIVTLASIGDGIITTDIHGHITFINKTAENLLGCSNEEIHKKSLNEIFTLIDGLNHEQLEIPFKEAIITGAPIGLNNNTKLMLKNGKEIYISASCAPIKNRKGGINGIVLVFRDISRIKLAEDKLTNEQKNLISIFNAAPIGMLILDNNLVIKKLNTSLARIAGKAEDEIINRRVGNGLGCLNSKEDHRGCGFGRLCMDCQFRKLLVDVYKSDVPIYGEEIQGAFFDEDLETPTWLRISSVPIIIDGKKNLIVTVDDITRSKQVEEELAKSRDFYLTLFEKFPAYIWRSGLDGKCDYFNKSWFDFTGRTLEQELGYGWVEGVHPEDREYCINTYISAFKKQKPFEMEYRLLRNDGEYRWLIDFGTPYCDLKGNFAGYIGSCYDNTERKLAEEGLKLYQILSQNAGDIIYFLDKNGNIIEANNAAVESYGYQQDELLNKTIFNIRKADKKVKIMSQMEAADSKGILFETSHFRKDGSSFPVEVRSQGTTINNKRVVLSIVRDITERKRITEELHKAKENAEAASRAKSEFLANMSHEIRTPLNGILGMSNLTLQTDLNLEQRENLQTIKSCSDSLLNVVNDILDFSKIEAGRMVIDNNIFDLYKLTKELIKSHSTRANEKGVLLNYSIDKDIPKLLIGDSLRVQQILNNLLGNAIKFTELGEVSLNIHTVNSYPKITEIKFSISDTGIGIAPEENEKLFKSFSQVDGSITRKYGGTGLGLAISKRLVEMMDGQIWVESEKGKGSNFSFVLKFKKSSEKYIQEKELETQQVTANSKNEINVLIVEDDKVNQMLLTKILNKKGYSYKIANNGKEALKILDEQNFDTILMDIQMPEMDGIATTKRIRSIEANTNQHIPIIALTAHALQGDKERFLSIGMDAYLAKPFQLEEFYRVINQFVSKDNYQKDLNNIEKKEEVDEQLDEKIIAINPIVDVHNLMDKLKNALENHNIIHAEKLAHVLKMYFNNNSETILKSLAFKIELALRKGDLTLALSIFSQLSQEIQDSKE